MFSNIARKASLAPVLLLAGGSLFAAPSSLSPDSKPAAVITIITVVPEYPASEEASSLLKQIQQDSVRLSNDGATLASSNRSGVTRKTQSTYLNAMKDRVNDTGANLARLQQIEANAAPWQQQAIEQLVPLAQQVASSTQAAIIHLNNNPQFMLAPTYTANLQQIAGSASDLKDCVNGFLSVAASNEKADRLHEKAYQLELKADQLQTKLTESNS